ncbi:DEAD/DEAH box helicase [Bacillus sp. Marseille-P3661]|uniref:DEAD/DEAH box helicase n=1 Tax=Bacillus sp. Marseille-P3661 TaxID=1936234 RepID=UPI000C856A97|nr:DEAD/DEAH box helicase [Bacillus sp. Marseille-P3661]
MGNNGSFKDYKISDDIVKALSNLHYKVPTEVQQKVIPVALDQKDLVVKARTGSGKTAAFGIPICELVEWEENKPQALVLTPTRELAAQVKEDLTNIGRFKRIKATAIYGKQSFVKQKLELKQKTHVVVGTPGRVLDHLEKGTLIVDKLKYLIIDEADEMLNMGFIDQVEAIIQKLPTERHTCLFSATLPADIERLYHSYMLNPIHIKLEETESMTKQITHKLVEVEEEQKFSALQAFTIVENPTSCIVFCRTKDGVDILLDGMNKLGYPCDKIHGGMYQEDRFEVMNDFKKGEFRYLIATDVAARGIDVENISLVINYDIPLEKESYVHRTGRTGRAGKKGKAITFMTPDEVKFLTEIEAYIGFNIPKIPVPSKETVDKAKAAFEEKINARPTLKVDKSVNLNQDIMKLYFNGGKKKKLRAVDFVGTIAKIDGIKAEDIGIITIQENETFVEILNGKGSIVLDVMKNTKIKGKQLKVHKAFE